MLPGDILLISCFISYVGCFTRRYRLELQNKMWIPTFKTITVSKYTKDISQSFLNFIISVDTLFISLLFRLEMEPIH